MKYCEKIFSVLVSNKTTLVLLLLFSIAIGAASFIENKYDTETADILVYNSLWLNVLYAALIVNFFGNLRKYNFFSRQKLHGLIFHAAFTVILAGAAVTRYTGYDGEMRITEGEESNIVYIAEPVLLIKYYDKGNENTYVRNIKIKKIGKNDFNFDINENIKISLKEYRHNVLKESLLANNAKPLIIELIVSEKSKNNKIFLSEGEHIEVNKVNFAYNAEEFNDDINFYGAGDSVFMKSKIELLRTAGVGFRGVMPIDTVIEINFGDVYNTQKGLVFQYKNLYKNTSKKALKEPETERLLDALILNIDIKGQIYEAEIYGQEEFIGVEQFFCFGDSRMSFAYGYRPVELPFSLFLEDYVIEKFPGTEIPSHHLSKLIIKDKEKEFEDKVEISPNNVLDYRGFRFFQLTYFDEETSSILSVNYDYWGTRISYSGYFLLIAGLMMIFVNKNSRFYNLLSELNKIHSAKKQNTNNSSSD